MIFFLTFCEILLTFKIREGGKDMAIVGDRIRECRESKGLSKTDLSEKTGLTIAAISQFESGERAPSMESLKKLADALEISVDYLIGIAEEISDSNIKAIFRGLEKLTKKDKEEMIHFYQFLKARHDHKKKGD